MSKDRFFKLDLTKNVTDWADQKEFQSAIMAKDELTDKVYRDDILKRFRRFRSIAGKTFINISFSFTTIRDISLSDCLFIDCLFIDSVFEKCEFHHCAFKNCNFYKATFHECYADPRQFEFANDLKRYSNIAVGLFQALGTNAHRENQKDHQAEAEFNFRKALRFQLKRDLDKTLLTKCAYRRKYYTACFFEFTAGYGWKPGRVVSSLAITFFVITFFNYCLWEFFGVMQINGDPAEHSIWTIAFYSISILTTLGPGVLMPTTKVGYTVMGIESLLG